MVGKGIVLAIAPANTPQTLELLKVHGHCLCSVQLTQIRPLDYL
ncbi:hypothetical protein [Leptolyngbya sp. O-77]|nr:hypothetical protein [Leptolyngbya sp. O-77]BAU44378.1 hypothetical protein O77CONTIG1_04217 [Leptolyngbya sp. O-77]